MAQLYGVPENWKDIRDNKHNQRFTTKEYKQITAMGNYYEENGPKTKNEIKQAMRALGWDYLGDSTQTVDRTVDWWLNVLNNKGCFVEINN